MTRIFLYLILGIFGLVARADIDPTFSPADTSTLLPFYVDEANNEDKATGAGLLQVPVDPQNPNGVKTELPFWQAQFLVFENSYVPIPTSVLPGSPNQNSQFVNKYAAYLLDCATRDQIWASLTGTDTGALKALFNYYAFLVLSENPSFATRAIPASCNATNIGVAEWTSLGTLFSDGPPNTYIPIRVSQFLTKMKSKLGAPTSDLLVLFMFDQFPAAFQIQSSVVQSTMQTTGTPYQLLLTKTTPSLAANNKIFDQISQQVPWEQMGMSEYTAFGYTPVSALLGEARYTYPVLSSLVPFVGAAMEALDNGVTAYTGRDALGNSASTTLSGTLFAANLAFALLDFSALKTATSATFNKIKTLSSSLRTAPTADHVIVVVKQQRTVLQLIRTTESGQTAAVGKEAADRVTFLGQRVPNSASLLNRAIGFSFEDSVDYLKTMHASVNEASGNLLTAQKSGSLQGSNYVQSTLDTLARGSNQLQGGDFGVKRLFFIPETLETPLTPYSTRYGSFFDMLKKFANYGETSHYAAEGKTVDVAANTMMGTLDDGSRVPLTTVLYSANWYEPDLTPGLSSITIEHWNPYWGYYGADGTYIAVKTPEDSVALYNKIMAQLKDRLLKVTDPSYAGYLADSEDAIGAIAELHWWLANLALYSRGSSGIADAFTKTLLHFRGISVGLWHNKVSADIWAFANDLENFKTIYAKLFQTSGDLRFSNNIAPNPVMQAKQGSGVNMLGIYQRLRAGSDPKDIEGIASVVKNTNQTIFSGWASTDAPMLWFDLDTPQWPTINSFAPVLLPLRVALVIGKDVNGTEVTNALVNQPSPSTLPSKYQQLGRAYSGYQFSVANNLLKTGTTYSIVATNMSSGEQDIIGQYTLGDVVQCSGISIPTSLQATGPFFSGVITKNTVLLTGTAGDPCYFVSAPIFVPFPALTANFFLSYAISKDTVTWTLSLIPGSIYYQYALDIGTTTSSLSSGFPSSLSFVMSCGSPGASYCAQTPFPDGSTVTVTPGN